ncbi:hypothetical protein TNCT_282011 [Trichonephila clavata]|uniref:Uncharacterized protein n=1 Tax=Trichonephila clavata TaxID=2740835 RepID=A0A8X6FH30_TRICU|nr:hypothetical protein TNCT_282011 [Trichonephila clavata]
MYTQTYDKCRTIKFPARIHSCKTNRDLQRSLFLFPELSMAAEVLFGQELREPRFQRLPRSQPVQLVLQLLSADRTRLSSRTPSPHQCPTFARVPALRLRYYER